MAFCSRTDGARRRGFRLGVVPAFALAGLALAGCGTSADGPGALNVDPGRYSAFHCNDLATRWKVLVAREKELRGLMDKANDGGAGALIGTLAYRSDYDSVLTEEKLIQREAADKKCDFKPDYQSDATIR